jgi:hypothetical protein
MRNSARHSACTVKLKSARVSSKRVDLLRHNVKLTVIDNGHAEGWILIVKFRQQPTRASVQLSL